MIQEYVNKLIENLPDTYKNQTTPVSMDLVLDGGAFNGSYLVGAVYFLKEMEKRNYIKIERISGCSIGAIVGLLYFIDSLDMFSELYKICVNQFKQKYNLEMIHQLKHLLKDKIPENVCSLIHGRLFITYHDVSCGGKKEVTSEYANVDELFSAILSSSHIPYLIDGTILRNDKYMDGVIPYLFPIDTNTTKKILYLDLFGHDKINAFLNVKNEKTNFHRILSGLLDIHTFYIKQTDTAMCSYVNDWSWYNRACYYAKLVFEYIVLCIVKSVVYINQNVNMPFKDTFFYELALKIKQVIIISFMEHYCL
jgi:hypothetical protein